ncbi:MAG: hypothetical protein GX640_17885 [Fibrobacter sp.]|nr:hypothetical protein [Fibrobacter sp.]
MHSTITKYSRNLEDAFFAENDRKLIEKLHEMKKMEESIESLAEVSGIENKDILKKLVKLNIRPETVAAIAMVSIVEVAWADGKLDAKEKTVILEIAQKQMHSSHEIARSLLAEWLDQKPPKEMLEAWIHYIQGLCEKFTDEERTAFKNSIMEHAYKIAEASGGFLGLGSKISDQEKVMLNVLESAFK